MDSNGSSADLYYLHRVNQSLYVLERVGDIEYPVSKKNVVQKTGTIIDFFLRLKVGIMTASQVYDIANIVIIHLEHGAHA
ncbi:hypothetical protein MBANPS3_004267 [Mucor bainieri]